MRAESFMSVSFHMNRSGAFFKPVMISLVLVYIRLGKSNNLQRDSRLYPSAGLLQDLTGVLAMSGDEDLGVKCG